MDIWEGAPQTDIFGGRRGRPTERATSKSLPKSLVFPNERNVLNFFRCIEAQMLSCLSRKQDVNIRRDARRGEVHSKGLAGLWKKTATQNSLAERIREHILQHVSHV